MTKQKATGKMLVLSVLSLFLCMIMLIGTTYAWFTDSVTSANNKVVAGTLDVQLLMHDGNQYVDISNGQLPIFGENTVALNSTNTLWEPGKTQVAYLAVKNNGTLDLRYELALNVMNPEDGKNLYEVMQYAIEKDKKYGVHPVDSWSNEKGSAVVVGTTIIDAATILKQGETHYFAFSVHMKEDAVNEYQGGKVNFDFIIRATQGASEEDSFGNNYDEGATYSVPEVKNEEEFLMALSQGGDIKLGSHIALTGEYTKIEKDVVIDLNGYEISAARNGKNGKLKGAVLCATGTDTHVTIKGKGAVINNNPGTSEYCIGVLADGGATVTIQGGNYYAWGAAGYVQDGLMIIEGGFFACDMAEPEPQYHYGDRDYNCYLAAVINCSKQSYINYAENQSGSKANVIIKGGIFVNEDPSNLHEGWYYYISHVDLDAYKVTSETKTNGDIWFTVVPK